MFVATTELSPVAAFKAADVSPDQTSTLKKTSDKPLCIAHLERRVRAPNLSRVMRESMTELMRKRRGDGHERRPEILKAARRVFSEQGYQNTTMRRVASEANLSPAGVYIYFPNKEAILAAIRDEMFGELHKSAQLAVSKTHDPEDRVRVHLRAYLDYARTDPDAYRLTFRSQLIHAPRPGRPSAGSYAIGLEAFNALVEDIAALMPLDGSSSMDVTGAHVMAEAVWAAVHGFSSLTIDVPGFPSSGIEKAFEGFLNMIVSGIRCASTP